ncbi:MAG: ABC transporter permease [Verrucomicrobiota bacterium JB023]|nr:ABC transporter permease [Verrucomicrobiota bacterium JB023]
MPDTELQEDFEVIIESNPSWFDIDWQGIVQYRDMLFFLVYRDFVAKYKQTILGPLWFIIQPLFMTLIFTVIFGKVAGLSTDGLPGVLFYLSGQLGWTYFAQCFSTTSTTFIANANLFGKVYFPRVVVPLSVVVSNLLAFTIQLVTFLCFWTYFKFFTDKGDLFGMSATIVLLPLLILQVAGIALGVGLWMSALTAKYRDLTHAASFLIQGWMYVTPVIYPLSEVPENWRWVVSLNPMTSVVESFRHMFLGTSSLTSGLVGMSVGITIVVALSGLALFNRVQRTFVDYS